MSVPICWQCSCVHLNMDSLIMLITRSRAFGTANSRGHLKTPRSWVIDFRCTSSFGGPLVCCRAGSYVVLMIVSVHMYNDHLFRCRIYSFLLDSALRSSSTVRSNYKSINKYFIVIAESVIGRVVSLQQKVYIVCLTRLKDPSTCHHSSAVERRNHCFASLAAVLGNILRLVKKDIIKVR